MRRVNLRLLAVLVLVAGFLGGAGWGLRRVQLRRTVRALFAEAAEAQKQGEFGRAELALARYLALRPDDIDALATHAALLERLARTPRDWANVLISYDQVLRSGPGRPKMRRRLVAIAMELGRTKEAARHLAVLDRSTPGDGELEWLQGRCSEAEGDFRAAAAWYEKARIHDHARLAAPVRLAALYRDRLAASARADRVIDEMVAANSQSFEAWLTRARYRKLLRLSGWEADLGKAASMAPDDPEVLLEQARALQERSESDQAEGVLVRALERHPDDPRMYAVLAEVEIRAGRTDQAIAHLRQGIERRPDQADLRWALAHLLAENGVTEELAGHVARLGKARYSSELLDYLNAWLCVNRGDWSGASRILERVGSALEKRADLEARVSYLKSRCFGQAGDANRQAAAVRKAVQLQPDWPLARLALAATLATEGKTAEAIEAYRAALALSFEARLPLAQLLITQNLGLPTSQRNWGEIEQLLSEASQRTPGELGVIVLRAELREAQGDPTTARVLLEGARQNEPTRVESWLALAGLADRQGRPAEAVEILDEAQRRLGDGAAIRLQRIALGVKHGGPGMVSELERHGADLERLPAAERLAVVQALAVAFNRLGDDEHACVYWDRLAEQDPKDTAARVALFDQARRAGDEAAMKRRRDELKRIENQGDLADLIEARYLAWRGGRGDRSALDAARSLVNSLRVRRPEWPPAVLASAEIDDRSGNSPAALQSYLRAIELGEANPTLLGRAAELLASSGRFAEADRLLTRLPESALRSGDLPRLAAEARLRTLLSQHSQTRADSDRTRLALADLLARDGRPTRAREALDLLRPQDEGTDELRVRAHVLAAQLDRGHRREAIAVLERLAGRAVLSQADRSLLAGLHEAMGDWPRALVHFEEMVRVQPDDPFALSQLAAGLLRHGQTTEVLPLVDRLEQLRPTSFLVVALRARLLHAQGRDAQAVARLESVAKSPGAPLDELATLLEELEQFNEAEALYRAAAARSDSPSAQLELARFLGRRGRAEEALEVCEGAWKTNPPEAVARACSVVLKASPADGKADRRVARWLEEEIAKAPHARGLLNSLASVRMRQGRYEAAEALYRRAVDGGDCVALNNLAWLAVLRRGDASGALALINRAIDLIGPGAELLDTRAVVLTALGQTAAALDDLHEALAEGPSATRYFHLAQAHWKDHDLGAATEALLRAKSLGLDASRLDPLERTAYDQLLAATALRRGEPTARSAATVGPQDR